MDRILGSLLYALVAGAAHETSWPLRAPVAAWLASLPVYLLDRAAPYLVAGALATGATLLAYLAHRFLWPRLPISIGLASVSLLAAIGVGTYVRAVASGVTRDDVVYGPLAAWLPGAFGLGAIAVLALWHAGALRWRAYSRPARESGRDLPLAAGLLALLGFLAAGQLTGALCGVALPRVWPVPTPGCNALLGLVYEPLLALYATFAILLAIDAARPFMRRRLRLSIAGGLALAAGLQFLLAWALIG